MGKLRLDISSSMVQDNYGVVDLIFNGVTLALLKQLSATVESLEYDVEILTTSNNVLKVALLNANAYDADGDGDYNNPAAGDQVLSAIVSALSYSADGVNFTTVLPYAGVDYTIPGGDRAGDTVNLVFHIPNVISYSDDFPIEFNSNGLVVSKYYHPNAVRAEQLENGNFLIISDDTVKDANWVTITN